MTVKFDLIEDISSGVVRYFSVMLGDNQLTEFEIFDEKDFPNHHEELVIIYNTLNESQLRGAKNYYFINESSAEYLPVVPQALKGINKVDFGLRLYAKRLRDDIVVLFNGDIKTENNPKDCPNVQAHCSRAIKIGLLLDKAIFNKDINLNDQNPFSDFELEI